MSSEKETCPRCGTPAAANQAFCSMCGTPLHAGAAGVPASSGDTLVTPPGAGLPPTQAAPAPPSATPYPPGSSAPYTPPNNPPVQSPPPPVYAGQPGPPPAGGYQPQARPPGGPLPPPTYARPQKDASGRVLAQIGCGTLIIILVIILICSGLTYAGYLLLRNSVSSNEPGTTSSDNSSAGQPNAPTATTMPTRTFPVNAAITYSSIEITIVNAQLGASFEGDDGSSNQNLLLRLNIQENNPTSKNIGYYYGDVAHLILPDHSSIAIARMQHGSPPLASATQTNWLDFAVPASIPVAKTLLRLGSPTEAQMDIPLSNRPNLSAYASKTVNNPPNAQTTYANLTWTITAATQAWSANGKQADANKRFVTVTLSVDNNTSRDFNAYFGDYLRLQAGTSRIAPADSNLPSTISAHSTKQTGWVIFLAPQDVSSFTLILLPSAFTGSSEEKSISFQIL